MINYHRLLLTFNVKNKSLIHYINYEFSEIILFRIFLFELIVYNIIQYIDTPITYVLYIGI